MPRDGAPPPLSRRQGLMSILLSRRMDILAWGLLLLCLPLLLWQSFPENQIPISASAFLTTHTLLEIISIAIATLIFFIAFGTRDTERSSRVVILGCFFLATAIFDTIHTLSYEGMPDIITPNSTDKMIWFWLVARLTAALGLLTYASMPESDFNHRDRRYLFLAMTLAAVALISFLILVFDANLPAMFIPGQGLTPLKIAIEWMVVALHLLTILIFYLRRKEANHFDIRSLVYALMLMAAGELMFTLYVQVSSTANILGHVYKVVAYGFLYRAIFSEAIRRPFIQIQGLNQQLQAERDYSTSLVNTAPVGILLLDTRGRILRVNPYFEQLTGYASQTILGKDWFTNFLPEDHRVRIIELFEHVVENRVVAYEVNPVRIRDGSVRTFEWISKVLLAEDDTVLGVLAIGQDITERKGMEDDLRLAAVAFESVEGMYVTDVNHRIIRSNRAFSKITGYSQAEVLEKNPTTLMAHPKDEVAASSISSALESYGVWQGELWCKRCQGEVYPALFSITAVKDGNGNTTHYVTTMIDITQHKAAEDEIRQLAFYDLLTELPNRRLLMDRLQQAMASSARSQSYGALLFIDLDKFKDLNDTLGHHVGDLLLMEVAQRLLTCVREGDTVARLGGDEFVLMLEDLGDVWTEAVVRVEAVSGKIFDVLNQVYHLGNHDYLISPSIGVTLFSGHQPGIDELLKRADMAMYKAKDAGRNTLRFYDPAMQDEITTRARLEADLRRALAQNELVLFYQMQVKGEQRTGAEVLLRWQHPERGLLGPDEFIPFAEETGLILPIGEWVLEEACRHLVAWAEDEQSAKLTMAVNISTKQFKQADFVERVLAILAQTGANPNCLELELTESLLIANVDEVITKMQALRAKGIRFSLDDFGTGYSSLYYLKQLPLEKLKIDRGFVRDIMLDHNDRQIAKTIIALAQGLELAVIAEGVETEEQRALLAEMGCDACQGYLFGYPRPLHEFVYEG